MKKRIKVVFGMNSFMVGGAEQQFVRQLKFFDRNKFEIILITLFQFPEEPDLYHKLPKDLPVYKLNFSGIKDIQSFFKLIRLFNKLNPDIVVSSLFFSNTIFRLLKPWYGYHSIAREHNTYIQKPFLHRLIDKILSLMCVYIVAVSTTVADFTAHQEGIRRKKFLVIHNGIDIKEVERELETLPSMEELKKEVGLTNTDRVLLNISRLVPQKNHQLLIDGFCLFQERYPAYKLLIVGDGGLRTSLEKYVQDIGAQEKVLFFGARHDIWKFYKIGEGFVSTSDIEGLSNTYLEALAAGVPVVATKTAGTDELIKEERNGFFIQKNTAEEVKKALEKLNSLLSRGSIRERCKESIQSFDIRETVKKYESLFERLMRS